MTVTALYPVLMTDRPTVLARFYAELLQLETVFEADWFVQLTGQMGSVARDHGSGPIAVGVSHREWTAESLA